MHTAISENYRPADKMFRVYPQRFWVLFVFAFLSFNQCMIWLTFSPIAGAARTFYQISESTVDLLLNWGPIIFLPTLPLVYVLLHTDNGFRKCVLIFAILPLLGTFMRIVPFIITSSGDSDFLRFSILCLHIGQILNAAAGPIAMALVSQLSCIWFAPHERTRATTMAILGGNFGCSIAFLISPLIVNEASRLPQLLYLHFAQTMIACILTLTYFPAKPPSPPSIAADTFSAYRAIKESSTVMLKRFMSDVYQCCQNKSFVLMVISGGLLGGAFSAWSGLFANILQPLGYSDLEAGWFGFGQTIACIIGSLLIGYVADQPRFQRSLKSFIVISLCCCFTTCFIFQLSVRSLLWPDRPLLPSNSLSIWILLSASGLFLGTALPLFYESLAEMMYPLPEFLSTSILVEVFNFVTLVFILIAPNRSQLINFLVLFVIGVSLVMVTCVKLTYQRKDKEMKQERREEYLTFVNECDI